MCRSYRRHVLTIVALLVIARAHDTEAQVIEGSVTTVLTGRSDPRDGVVYTVVPVYQLLSMSLRNVAVPGGDRYVSDVRIEVSAWLGGDIGQPIGGQRFLGDLNLAYVEAKLLRRRVEVRLGRQLIVGGVARFTHLDGGSVRVVLWRGLSAMAFGGVPVIQAFGVKVGDATAGARVAYRFNYGSDLGLSFVHVEDKGRASRQDLGLDARVQAHRMVSVSGLVVMSLLEKQLAQVDIGITVEPIRAFTARLDYSHEVPNLWIPRSSIFSVFSDTTRDELGGQFELRWPHVLQLRTDYHVIVEPAGVGQRGGARLTLIPGAPGRMQIGLEFRALKRQGPGYYQGRIFAYHRPIPNLLLSLDVDAYVFDVAQNGRKFSVTGSIAMAWEFARHFRVGASAAVNASPFVDNGYDFMLKLAYNSVARFRETH